ncbi:MAG: helicase-related protein [Patescibacteria group bacterium]|jgi:ERCC4-related helicase|nr:helicase-related protein [Patescibacteria group bacterium]
MNIWIDDYEPIWSQLNFDPEKASKEKARAWKSGSKKVIELAKTQNVGIVADTSSGKTLISFLVTLATNARVLFLTPRVILPTQHQKVLSSIAGGKCLSRVITGETKRKDRVWDNKEEKFVFATPQTALIEINNNLLDLNDFQILIIDEFHMAVGEYDYVPLASLANDLGIRIIGLTASPGSNFKKISEVCANCHITTLKRLFIKTADKELNKINIPVDDLFIKVDIDFGFLLDDIKMQLFELLNEKPPDGILTSKKLDSLVEIIEEKTNKKDKSIFHAFKLYGMYRKLIHCYRTVVIDGYDTFLEYAEKLRTEGKASSREIVKMPEFQKIVYFVKYCCYTHPKVSNLTGLIVDWVGQKKNGLIFVYQRNTAKYLSEELENNGIRVGIITSKDSKKSHEEEEILSNLAKGEIDIVVCTTILQMGVSVPEIDAVFHFDLPSSIIAKIQKDGRTGRVKSGNVFYLVLNHPIDLERYIAIQSQLKRMHAAIDKFNEQQNELIYKIKNKKEPIPFLDTSLKRAVKRKKKSEINNKQFELF